MRGILRFHAVVRADSTCGHRRAPEGSGDGAALFTVVGAGEGIRTLDIQLGTSHFLNSFKHLQEKQLRKTPNPINGLHILRKTVVPWFSAVTSPPFNRD
jgi:hypothetical protein